MDLTEMQARARAVRARYADVERAAYGRRVDLEAAFTSTMDGLDAHLAARQAEGS